MNWILNKALLDDTFRRPFVTFGEEDLVAGIATIEGMIDLRGKIGAKSTRYCLIAKAGSKSKSVHEFSNSAPDTFLTRDKRGEVLLLMWNWFGFSIQSRRRLTVVGFRV